MVVFSVVVLLSVAPTAAEAWSQKACPPPKQTADSNVEMKLAEQQRATCLRKAMNKALDKVIVPLKKSKPAAFKEWMELQADYNRWMADACAAVEEANWVDLSTGERSMGTGYGFTESTCQQQQYAWRGFYADAWARGDWAGIQKALEALSGPAREARKTLDAYRTRVQQAASRASTPASEADLPTRQLSQDDWKLYSERLARAAAGPEALARRQCPLLPSPPADCAQRFAEALSARLDFSEALGDSAPSP